MAQQDDGSNGPPPAEGKRYRKVPGRLARTFMTGSLGGLVSSSYVGGKVLDRFRSADGRDAAQARRHEKNALRVLETMADLRGPVMKIGQLLSTHKDLLPDSYGQLLERLQSKAPPMPYAQVERVFSEEFETTPDKLFARFEHEAHAAASLGQVHRAWLHTGEAVAVKVQYPGADAMVDGDLKNLELGIKLVKSIGADVMRQRNLDFSPVYEEIAEHMRQETDLCREAWNAQLLGEVFRDHPDIVVPKVYLEYSGLRVITYEFIEGQDIGSFIGQGDDLDQALKERAAALLTDAFWGQFVRQGVIHADPHPGNYFITPDHKLALLDFGCVKIFDPDTVVGFIDLVRAYLARDVDLTRDALVRLEMVSDADNLTELDDLMRIGAYFCTGLDQDDVYSFVDNNYAERGRQLIEYFISSRRIPKAQKDFIFLTRVILGYFEYFSRMRLAMNFRRIALPHIERGWQGRAAEIPDFYLEP